MKILIAEDHFACRNLLACVLKKSGHDVVETQNGSEAWEALQQPDPPKLLILDWMMPEMEGPEVVRRVRSQHTYRPPYIIMLTTKGEKDHIIAALTAGANDYLTKPFDAGELLVRLEVGERSVEMQLRQHQQRAHAQRVRVEADQRMTDLQGALASKADELRRSQADLQVLGARLETVRQEERTRISGALHDSFGKNLNTLQTDLIAMDRQLRSSNDALQPDPLGDQLAGMLRVVERLSDQTHTICASLLTSV